MGELTMKRPTVNDTKEVIMEYVKGLEAELDKAKAGKFDPAAEKEAGRKKEVAVKAKKIIDRGIVNNEIMDEYSALTERISDLKVEIENLTGISVTIGTFAALIEANNIEIAEAKAIKDEVVASKREELDALEEEIKAKKLAWADEDKKYKDDLKITRTREEADHKYNLDRTRAKDNDIWEDQKALRQKEIDNREDVLDEREQACLVIEELNVTLQAQVDALPKQIAEIQNKATEDAEKAAAKTFAIKENAMKKEVEFDKKMVDAKLVDTEKALAKAEAALITKEAELKEAYAKMNDLATKSVQAGQSVYVNKDAK
jgi:hypothetical protein